MYIFESEEECLILKTLYQQFIYKRTYARWDNEKQRRENWLETVHRYWRFFRRKVPVDLLTDFMNAVTAVENLEVMPSMRALWTAGKPLELENIAGYNCAYTTVESPKDFAEIMYILMCGTGVGFSVERQYINKLPEVPKKLREGWGSEPQLVVKDSRKGWAFAYYKLLSDLYVGYIPMMCYSEIRPKGAPLKTFGGRASGPEPLKQLVDFTIETFKKARGRKLNSLECYDLVTMIANVVIAGGVRRSATISLSNLSDQRMKHAKDGQFWIDNPQRSLSNNSVAYTEKPDINAFMEEWSNLMKSGSGERGIVNRVSLQESAKTCHREHLEHLGVNPCGEIILRPKQFCNLTEVVLRPTDTYSDFMTKIEYATILGVLQSTLTDFNFLSDEWKKNCEEERLLGVSLTGLKDHPVLSEVTSDSKSWLYDGKCRAKAVAEYWANALGINVPKAVTTVKPSGTVSQLVNTSSGMHERYAPYYIRRVRVATTDPLAGFLMDKGVPWNPEVGQTIDDMTTVVFEFPEKAPNKVIKEQSALEQLEYWKMIKTYWTDHNPSVTIYVKPEEWLEVGAWVYKHFDIIGGLSFLPKDTGVYQLAPYEEITEEEYLKKKAHLDNLDISWEDLDLFERGDTTEGSREWACSGDRCEIS